MMMRRMMIMMMRKWAGRESCGWTRYLTKERASESKVGKINKYTQIQTHIHIDTHI
jgi:hypothetical protein